MILHTAIAPRKDGTVVARGPSGRAWVFQRTADGEMACDVSHDDDVAHLLATGRFYPANEADFDVALALTKRDGLEDDDDDDDKREPSPPIEAATPPSPKRARKARS